MPNKIHLLGIDIGSTTLRGILVEAWVNSAANGENELHEHRTLWAPAAQLTPRSGESLDIPALERVLESWQQALRPYSPFSTGVLFTGLASRARNRREAEASIDALFPSATVVAPDEPRFESWLAFMGGARSYSQREPTKVVLHLDIGGGTTNLAWGKGGEVFSSASLFLGARHVRFKAGTTCVAELSDHALLWSGPAPLRPLAPGQTLTALEMDLICDGVVQRLEHYLCQQAFDERLIETGTSQRPTPDLLSVSGGISEWIYHPNTLPEGLAFDDLGVPLARAFLRSKYFGRFTRLPPSSLGTATVCGLASFGTSFSGESLYLPAHHLEQLPLRQVPVVRHVLSPRSDSQLEHLFQFSPHPTGRAYYLTVNGISPSELSACAEVLKQSWSRLSPEQRQVPCVLLVDANCGKFLGSMISDWGRTQGSLYVLDQLPPPRGNLVCVGVPLLGSLPVSYLGML